MTRRRLRYGIVAIGLLGLTWGLSHGVASWRYHEDLRRADRAIASGRYGAARDLLARLAGRWPGREEVEFPLGLCERAEGRPEAALAAWARVSAGSPRAARAMLLRAETLLELGRWSEAEAVLVPTSQGTTPEANEARRRLAQLFNGQGRLDEARRLLQEAWARAPDRAKALRELWMLESDPILAEVIRSSLDRADPDDDRVWLGKANLAIWAGRFDEAARWLDRCDRSRPGDPAIWRSRLDLALATGDLAGVRRALPHLPADRLAPADVLRLRARLAALQDDRDAEWQALERLIAEDPGAVGALERLAILAIAGGQVERAAAWRRRKAEIDRARERYRQLLKAPPPAGSEESLALLAEAMGRRFEARGWWILANRRDPGRPDVRAALARLEPAATPPAPPGRTLADLLGDLVPAAAAEAPPRGTTPPGAPPVFTDDAEAAGLRFVFDGGASPLHQLPETMSGGVGLLDSDGDGWLDVYLVQGGPFPPDPTRARPGGGDRLFRNRRDGTFEDVTESAGLAELARGYGHGVTVGDYDNDGDPDLFLTRWRRYILLRNRGDGTFEEVTAVAGLDGDRDWPTSAVFADLDCDGDLDLYVCHYLRWATEHPRVCQGPPGVNHPGYCDPRDFPALSDHLFRNDGGRFVDVTAEAGIVDEDGRGLGVVAADLDEDGQIDLYVANDTTANYLFRNRGDWRFEEVGHAAGVAAAADGGYQAGMGIGCGDLDGDGRLDLAVTNFYGESTTLYRNLGGGLFQDVTAAVGLAAASRFLLGFGIAAVDVNNDGRLDLATANGHVNDYRPLFPYAMPAQLLIGGPGGRLTDASASAGPPWRVPRVGRGLVAGDLDNDGRIDLVLVSQNEPLAYLHNRAEGGHFVAFGLEGLASNRDGLGARVAVTAGGRCLRAQRLGGGSYLSACDGRLQFGLGSAGRVEAVEVHWPSGRVDRFADLAVDTGYLLREGDAEPKPLPGFPSRDSHVLDPDPALN